MEVNHKEILNGHIIQIRKDLNPMRVLPYFIKSGTLSDEEIEQITGISTRSGRCDKLIELLKRSNIGAFDTFVRTLVTVKPHLACLVLQSGGSRRFQFDQIFFASPNPSTKISGNFEWKIKRNQETIW